MKKIINIVILISAMILLNSCITLIQGMELNEIQSEYENYKLTTKTDDFEFEIQVVKVEDELRYANSQLCMIKIKDEVIKCLAYIIYDSSFIISEYTGNGELHKSYSPTYYKIRELGKFAINKKNNKYVINILESIEGLNNKGMEIDLAFEELKEDEINFDNFLSASWENENITILGDISCQIRNHVDSYYCAIIKNKDIEFLLFFYDGGKFEMKEIKDDDLTGKTIKGNYIYKNRKLTFNILENDIDKELNNEIVVKLSPKDYWW